MTDNPSPEQTIHRLHYDGDALARALSSATLPADERITCECGWISVPGAESWADANEHLKSQKTPASPIRISINFVDGTKMETAINVEDGAFSFRVLPDCPAISSLSIAAPGSKVEFLL